MALEIVMPALEMAQKVGTLLRWLKEEREFVRKGEPLMLIETDKATIEIESPGSGILSNVSAQAGDEIPVGHVIALLVDEEKQLPNAAETPFSISRPSHERIEGSTLVNAVGTVTDTFGEKTLIQSISPKLPPASPKARRLASEYGLNLAIVRGSGRDGAVLAADVSKPIDQSSPRSEDEESFTVVPLKGKRKTIAERTQRSYQVAPHISLSVSIDMSEVQRLRERLNSITKSESVGPLKITSVLLKVVAEALVKHPRLNAHFVDPEIREYKRVHLGVAVALEDGLIVPVIRDAHQKGLTASHIELQDLLLRARTGRLRPHEIKGSTFTISNLGMFGIEQFSAILNTPEVGILSVGCVSDRPIGVQGRVALRPMMQATLNVDHRAIDGAVAARFLQTVKALLEDPSLDNISSFGDQGN